LLTFTSDFDKFEYYKTTAKNILNSFTVTDWTNLLLAHVFTCAKLWKKL
jgi:hypothetical protein